MRNSAHSGRLLFLLVFMVGTIVPFHSYAQWENKWMSAGSIHNWFSESGCEIEHGNYASQQYGLQWPAILDY